MEKTLVSPLDCKEIQPVHPKADQSWVFIGTMGHVGNARENLELCLYFRAYVHGFCFSLSQVRAEDEALLINSPSHSPLLFSLDLLPLFYI